MDRSLYIYEGPVLEFGKLIMAKWSGQTYANSEKKAKSNLSYQFKSQYERMPTAKISLPGEVKLVG